MKVPATLRWVGLALLGILIAAGVSVAASSLASRQIGLASEPISAGDALAPARAEGAPGHRRHRHRHEHSQRQGGPSESPPAEPPPPAQPPEEALPPEPPVPASPAGRQGDDSGGGGGGHGADD